MRRSVREEDEVGVGVGGGKAMFDLQMKKTEGMSSTHTVSNGFSRPAEWTLAVLKIVVFVNCAKGEMR